MKILTKAEEQVMHNLWKIKKGFLKDIVEQFPNPKPANTTVSTIIRILVNKGFIGFKTYGKVNEYYPLISKREYLKFSFKNILNDYFNNSYQNFTSFFTNEHDFSLSELEQIKGIIEQQIIKQREKKDG